MNSIQGEANMSQISQDIYSGKIYLVNGKRTAFGKFGGSLAGVTPVDLSVCAGKGALESSGVNPEDIDHVILGNVLPSSTDTLYGARHVGLKIGVPMEKPAYLLNRLCGSGIQSILDAVRLIRLGEAGCVLAGGTENMSMAPHAVYGGRFGTKYGALQTVDFLLDSLTDKHSGCPMGITAENLAEKYSLTRKECEVYSANSHKKYLAAQAAGNFKEEITPFELKRGTLEIDEHPREDINIEGMAKLRTSFKKEGTVTPATASGIVDGSAMVVVASEEYCNKNGLTPLAEIVDGRVVGVDPTIMGIGPVPAINELLERNKKSIADIGLIEINEAFASQVISCQKELSIPDEKLNIWGGAVAIGHPLAATGTRISLTLARQLKANDIEFGIASACIGGGQGISVLLKSVK